MKQNLNINLLTNSGYNYSSKNKQCQGYRLSELLHLKNKFVVISVKGISVKRVEQFEVQICFPRAII